MKKRSLVVPRLPSAGFVLIAVSCLVFLGFLAWVSGEDWYDHFGRTRDAEHRHEVMSGYANYLEWLAPRLDSEDSVVETWRRAFRVRKRIGDDEGARATMIALEKLLGEDAVKIVVTGVASDGWTTDRNDGIITILNLSNQIVKHRLWLNYFQENENMPITATVEERTSGRQQSLVFEGAERQEILLEVAPGIERTWSLRTDKWFRTESDSRLLGIHVRLVAAGSEKPGKEESAAPPKPLQVQGVQSDGWTIGGVPGIVTMRNRTDKPMKRVLRLLYWLDNESMPITVTIREETSGDEEALVFFEAEMREIVLSVPPGEERVWTIHTDKTFRVADDSRDLGVHVEIAADGSDDD